MQENKSYRLVEKGKKAVRRDYSKVSGELAIPYLVEIQTSSFEWFINEGLKEVFNDIYPITNYSGNIRLNFVDYSFDDAKLSINECKYREVNYSAPLKAKMELEVLDEESGEFVRKEEEVFLGDFPLMTPTGTFIINGAERVIVSQIVRSPGSYFKIASEERTGNDSYLGELIPSRGTWLEFMTDGKKAALGNILNMSVDRKRKILSTVLYKTLGLSLDLENGEDAFDTSKMEKYLKSMGKEVYTDNKVEGEDRVFTNIYMLLYTSFFGNYEEIVNTLAADKISTRTESLINIYENQRSDEVPTIEGSINLMNAKFFDKKRYDLTRAGRYKLNQKLGVVERMEKNYTAEDIYGADGSLIYPKNTLITKVEREVLKAEFAKGAHMHAFPMNYLFSHPEIATMQTVGYKALVGRILAEDIELDDAYFEKGLVINEVEAEILRDKVKEVKVYASIIAEKVVVNADNASAVLNYGERLFTFGRIEMNGSDFIVDDELAVDRYVVDGDVTYLSSATFDAIMNQVNVGNQLSIWQVGTANQVVSVYTPEDLNNPIKVIGVDPINVKRAIEISDMYAFLSYELNMLDGVGKIDDIDQLGNRRIRTVGELIQNQFRIGLARMERVVKERMSIQDATSVSPKALTNIRPLTAAIKEFFSSSQLSQFMDQLNPLAELTNKRRISALGPGGLTRERASFEVRDVHNSHYGRICPIETPEGPNIGLISNLTTYARVNEYGFIQTPYRKVTKDGKVLEEYIYLSADEENDYVIAQANECIDGHLVNEHVVARVAGETVAVNRNQVELADVSPKQIISIAAGCIPFLENDDASRALMGANMQRQAVPLLSPHSPHVGTGIEHAIAKDSGAGLISNTKGIVTYVDAKEIKIQDEEGQEVVYELTKFRRSNAGTCLNHKPLVNVGEHVEYGQMLCDGPSMQNGELALGQNVTIAFMTWHGYNYEDAIIMSERMVKEDVYTSIHIEEYDLECRDTKLGPEEITRDIPNVGENSLRHLDGRGIVMVGAEVKEGDILVGKVTPKGQSEVSPEEKLLLAIFGEKSREVRDNSLKVPHGGAGTVQSVRVFKRSEGYDLAPGVNEVVKIYIVQKRKIHEGDKMAGRHGNKGVISKILPVEDMPFMPDGTPVDIMLNPFGVPSRMNIGQVLEIYGRSWIKLWW